MKLRYLLFALALIGATPASLLSQQGEHLYGLGIHMGVLGYQGDYGNHFFSGGQGFAGGIHLSRRMNDSFDAMALLFIGALGEVYSTKAPEYHFNMIHGDLHLMGRYKFSNGKILSKNNLFSPLVQAGVGVNMADASGHGHEGVFDGFSIQPSVIVGAGTLIRLNNMVSLQLQSNLFVPFTDRLDGWYPDNNANTSPDFFLLTTLGIVLQTWL